MGIGSSLSARAIAGVGLCEDLSGFPGALMKKIGGTKGGGAVAVRHLAFSELADGSCA